MYANENEKRKQNKKLEDKVRVGCDMYVQYNNIYTNEQTNIYTAITKDFNPVSRQFCHTQTRKKTAEETHHKKLNLTIERSNHFSLVSRRRCSCLKVVEDRLPITPVCSGCLFSFALHFGLECVQIHVQHGVSELGC